ncbi:hypothetical protein STM14_2871 [Salmonella enterica subsp. enterica serovar Typhimurium str. 14028S]|uniref:Uncharacterized protein n=2 Tax=Salmonella enterica I TaxID=59201 RepID=A0A0F6B469_SALT1|nr:hypothetical protein SPAB_00648 [Salmonella enterica subsp. enterica serovar Paratyphi B str. SPB7]ACY89310.1 hypothetical protein STM14_2871 [Salmonella enterica subsp. enterica serovar Typhimurium str. 14028S]
MCYFFCFTTDTIQQHKIPPGRRVIFSRMALNVNGDELM